MVIVLTITILLLIITIKLHDRHRLRARHLPVAAPLRLPTLQEVVSKHAKGVHHSEQLEDVRRVGLLGCRQITALVPTGWWWPSSIRLGEHGRDGHLASIGGNDGAAPSARGRAGHTAVSTGRQCQRSRRRSGGSSCTAPRSGVARRWMAGRANPARPRPCAGPLPPLLPRPDGQGSPAPRGRRGTWRP